MAEQADINTGGGAVEVSAPPTLTERVFDSDLWYSFTRSKVTVVAAIVSAFFILGALFAPLIAPFDPYDLASVDALESFTPPAWQEYGLPQYWLGTDELGRDLLSSIIYATRTSLFIGAASVLLSIVLGVGLGLLSGFVGGKVDAFIMRIAEIQLSFPAILVALLLNGILRGILTNIDPVIVAYSVLILSIGLSGWVQYARTVRGSTLVERNKEYVQAARVMGIHPGIIMLRHILPNVMGPVLVIATISLALAIISEATLSFLGVGMPATEPSLGTLIRIGNDFLFSGEWWMTIIPGVVLAALALAVNLLGDWLRDALNPKLR